MGAKSSHKREIVVGDERFSRVDRDRPVATSAERYVMSESRAPRLAIKEGELFLYSDALRPCAGSRSTRRSASTSATRDS